MKITTASGEISEYSEAKIASSLRRSGAQEHVIADILHNLRAHIHPNISTKKIYKIAFDLLQQQDGLTASRYKLKKAIYELGPTGFPFEKFIGALFENSGYHVQVGKILQGTCVSHEVDVIAETEGLKMFMECKFHSEQGKKCDVKIPLYINSRFVDLESYQLKNHSKEEVRHEGWVITNTRFTKDAIAYGQCVGLKLLGWDFPKGEGLKERIDKLGLYPITVSTLLSTREKQFLLSRDNVLCRQLLKDDFLLDQLEISKNRKKRILKEMQELIAPAKKHGKLS
ncbi:restriction endonuclease [Salinimicrobium sp. MT39]|uniref:Restriction endonuclease n=1 Tax=Salinimicrobium profundisediminis TaxID=2994553 RepID=A0A9X3CZS3_9FLAO|nr:restriction endonuclease [Salinimicrobium profundisediminis]MCX2839758.1 restriction endonuclease [Salinimicrobium profundisediminis]